MRNRTFLSIAIPCFFATWAVAQGEDPLPEASPAVTAEELHHHVAFLASDELKGRATSSPELERAAHYLARSLERAGVSPGGDDGSFLQRVPLTRTVHRKVPEMRVVLKDGRELEVLYGQDFDVSIRGRGDVTEVLALKHIQGLDDLPARASREVAVFFDGSSRERTEWLSERDMGSGEGWGLYLRPGARSAGKPRTELRPGRLRMAEESASEEVDPCDVVRVRGDLRKALEAGDVASLSFTTFASEELSHDHNVIGVLPGVGKPGDEGLAGEAIVLSAHIDHIGVRGAPGSDDGHGHAEEGEVDLINNGADDDASGTAALLEIAEALVAEGPTARTVVFLFATAEEVGLLGTRWYLDHPVVSLEKTVCNLNFEMIGRPDELVGGVGRLWLTGFEYTNLGPAFAERGLPVMADLRPEQNFYKRSDNYAFVRRGVIGQTLSSYNMHKDYHTVRDEVEALDFEHMRQAVQAGLDGVRLLASGELTPEWAEGHGPAD